ncbi:MAG: thioredoxin family protein [Oligoflexia bacterium]|nr:thioredoxin family protein [Oligoflexia bacterium]
MQRDTRSTKFPIGSALPKFQLQNVDGKLLGSECLQGAKAALVVFSCNHCPYVQGTDALLLEIVKRFEPRGLKTVAISANDPVQYPEDGFAQMQTKAKTLKLPFPYLFDETQAVARAFDASCTPECYLFDGAGKLCYQGAITDRPKERDAERKDLLSPAIESTLSGKAPVPDFNHPIGCSIKWKN